MQQKYLVNARLNICKPLFAFSLVFFLSSLSILVSKVEAEPSFFEASRLPLIYEYWGSVKNFRDELAEVDIDNYLKHEVKVDDITDADLFFFVVNSWRELSDIPIRYAGFIPIFERVGYEKTSTESVNVSIRVGADLRPVRLHFVNLSNVSEKNKSNDCFFHYIYLTALFVDPNVRLEVLNCERSEQKP